ncbi:hypothetical protein CQW23_02792 [Capsicum baccatum]|uniref:Oberon coiled-coil region domain-containing protein n=1 Tax=Capsicum baccatum TaxID=33114 RepID=A0A2G2XSK3_CAPBA|nr:hypothetical protein CQW23_02792 [Capsicum baccatum]
MNFCTKPVFAATIAIKKMVVPIRECRGPILDLVDVRAPRIEKPGFLAKLPEMWRGLVNIYLLAVRGPVAACPGIIEALCNIARSSRGNSLRQKCKSRADDARGEAGSLRRLATLKSEKLEDEYSEKLSKLLVAGN